MSQPETKTVLGRVFTWDSVTWHCHIKCNQLLSLFPPNRKFKESHWTAELTNEQAVVASGKGPTEADAILALQSTLRKMAELEVEVVGG